MTGWDVLWALFALGRPLRRPPHTGSVRRAAQPHRRRCARRRARGRAGAHADTGDRGARAGAAAVPLARHARRAARPAWTAVGRAVAVAVLPLPLLVVLDALLVRGAYQVLTLVLPAGVSLYLVSTYAVVLALLLGLTYAAVPVLAAHQGRAEESHA